MSNADDVEKAKARLRALREMTEARGCTEAEAQAAAAKAAEIMARFGLDEADVDMTEAEIRLKTKGTGIRDRLWSTVGYVTNTAPIVLHGHGECVIRFYGRDPYPEIACYLKDVLDWAIDRGIREFKASRWYRARRNNRTRRQAIAEFTEAMVNRLSDMLLRQFAGRWNDVQRREAAGYLAGKYPLRRPVSAREVQPEFHEAYWQGRMAAGWVKIHDGIGGTGTAPALPRE